VASVAAEINDAGEIVGISIDHAGNLRAVYWHNGTPIDLNTQVAASNLYLLWASDINDHGEIAGWGVDSSTGEIHTFLAIPNRAGSGAIPEVSLASSPTAPVPLPEAIRQRLQHGFAPRSQH
jgi:probable HAF family extracellular repeat protein